MTQTATILFLAKNSLKGIRFSAEPIIRFLITKFSQFDLIYEHQKYHDLVRFIHKGLKQVNNPNYIELQKLFNGEITQQKNLDTEYKNFALQEGLIFFA